MYNTEYCEVSYEKERNVVLVKWKKYCTHSDYRRPLEYALEIMRAHEGCEYAADTRSGFENHPDDTQWVSEYFFPEAVKAGCSRIYFIIDGDNTLREELEGQENSAGEGLRFVYVYAIDEIER